MAGWYRIEWILPKMQLREGQLPGPGFASAVCQLHAITWLWPGEQIQPLGGSEYKGCRRPKFKCWKEQSRQKTKILGFCRFSAIWLCWIGKIVLWGLQEIQTASRSRSYRSRCVKWLHQVKIGPQQRQNRSNHPGIRTFYRIRRHLINRRLSQAPLSIFKRFRKRSRRLRQSPTIRKALDLPSLNRHLSSKLGIPEIRP